MGSTEKLAILLPAYNEELTIIKTIEGFQKEAPNALIVVIDNASTDSTAMLVKQYFQQNKTNGILIFEPLKGKGNAIRKAFAEIEADIYVMADADETYPADELNKLIQPILKKKADMVVGDRISSGRYRQENKRFLHDFGNNFVLNLVNRFFKSNLKDIMSGYRAFNKKFVKNYPILVSGFELETDMTLHALDKRFSIVEVDIEYKDRPQGSVSKLDTLSDGAKVIFTIFQILRYYKPFQFFGFIAILLGIAGLIASMPVFDDWVTHQYIYHVPLAILAVGLEISAILSFGIGLILDNISHQSAFMFEKSILQWVDKD